MSAHLRRIIMVIVDSTNLFLSFSLSLFFSLSLRHHDVFDTLLPLRRRDRDREIVIHSDIHSSSSRRRLRVLLLPQHSVTLIMLLMMYCQDSHNAQDSTSRKRVDLLTRSRGEEHRWNYLAARGQ